MTFDEFRTLVQPLSVVLGAEFDLPTWKLYHRALENVPVALLGAAVTKAAQTRTKMPSAAQLREMAEGERQALIAANPYDGCVECEMQKGWRNVLVDGVLKVERCPCRDRHTAKLARLGVGDQPLALPAARESTWTQASDDAA